MYGAGIDFTGIAAINPPGTVTGANDGASLDALTSSIVRLGQDIGQAGSPASLFDDREIPLLTFGINFLTGGNSLFRLQGGGPVAALWDQGTSSNQFLELLTIQGRLPLPSTFGNFQIGWLDQSFTNPDGQIDAVMSIGYNTDGSNGKINPGEAAFATVIESHFQQGGVGNGTFEWYLMTDSRTGVINRHMFLIVDKVTGQTQMNWKTDTFEINSTTGFGNNTYLNMQSNGTMVLTGQTGDSSLFSVATTTPDLDGGLVIACVPGGNGKTNIDILSNASTAFVQFGASRMDVALFLIQGFANFWVQSIAPNAATRGWIFQNANRDPGVEEVAFWNNGNNSFTHNSFFGGSNALATAFVHCAAGGSTPGSGPLKMTASGLVLAAPEDGVFEYDGTNLFFTVGATRKTVTLI